MAKIIIVLLAFVACASAKPGIIAPLAPASLAAAPLTYPAPLTAAYTAPLAAYSAPLTYPAPLAYSGSLIAPGGSSRIDIQNNYNAGLLSAPYAYASGLAAYRAAPLAYTAPAARLAYAPRAFATAAYTAPAAYAASYAYPSLTAAAPLRYTTSPLLL